MKWFDDIKIRYKLFIVFGVLMGVMVYFALFTVSHINTISNDINELINSHQARQIHVADAIEVSFRIRVINNSLGHMLLVGDDYLNTVASYRGNHDGYAAAFLENLHGYRDKMLEDPHLYESEKRYRLDMVNDIEQVYGEYADITGALVDAVENNDKDKLLRIYREATPKGMELSEKLQALRDEVFSAAGQKAKEATDEASETLKAVFAIAVAFIVISALTLLFTVRNIDRPITRLEKAIKEITGGNLTYPIRDDRGDELGSLSNQIGNMVDRISEHNKVMTILDNLDSMICVCDLDYNMLYVNKSMVDAFGMDPENYTKQKCYKATRNKEEPCEFCPFGDISGQEESFPPPRNFEYIWDDKINRWVSGTNSVIRWLDGTMVLFIFMRDASHIKQQEELSMWQTKELAFQKVKLQSVFDAIPDVVFVKDLNLRFAQCNKTMRDVFNRREEDLIGKNEIDGLGYSPEAAEMVFSHERMVINEGCRVVVEETVPVLGDKRIFESVKVPLRQGDSIIGLIGIVRDITAHKRMEKKQEELAHWYKSILDATPSLISVTDADMKWTFVNKAVEDHLGTSLENMRGRPCSNWNANICNTNSCGIACAKRGENRTFFTHDGVSYQVDAEILKAMNGEVAGFIEIIQDITKIREMEEEALSASKAKSQFLANMSHEIRTPMNAIMGITEILLQDNALRPDIIEALKRIYNSGDLLLNIINEILDLSKIEAGKLELAPAKYNIASLISDTATLNMMRIGGKAIEFELSVDENTPSDLFGDELRIKQILNNLLSNAFKYTKEGLVKLSVSAEMGGPKNESEVTLVFRVSDTGQGMTEEQISRLFDEYSRFNTEANRTTEGAGLGMSITRKLIHLMNGEISVKSALDQGSEFTIYLPQGRIGSAVIGASLAENLQKFKTTGEDPVKRAQLVFEPMPYGGVLVVDDVESNLYVAKGLLSPYQLSVETVMSGYEALEKITQGKTYDVIFMDHMMPQMDGLETTQKIRAFGYSGAIVALTANALAGSDEIFRQNGFDGFISKPIDLRQLNGILHKFIRNRHPEKAKRQKPETPARTERPGITPELMRIFRRDAGKAAATLRESLAGGDIKLFTTTAHAMKSALAYIGESEASRSALALESAGHEGDTDFIAANADGFIKRLEALAESPPPAEAAEADAAEDTAFLAEQLQIVKSACEGYDDAAAYAALDRLKEKAWKPKTAAALKEIRDALFLHSDFDGAAERAGAFLG